MTSILCWIVFSQIVLANMIPLKEYQEEEEKDEMFQVNQLEKSSGIYYENVGYVKFYTNNWKIITYLNISALENKLNLFQGVLTQTNQLCHNPLLLTYSACTTSLNLLLKLQPTIVEQHTAFKDLVGHTRSKRGLFDGIGKVAKLLIGTLDADDAERYNNAINELQFDDKDLTNLLKTQTQIIQSTISNFNNTLTNLHHAEEIFNNHINLIKNLTLTTNKTLQTQSLKQTIEDHLTLLLLLFTELNHEYSNLIHAILLAKQNLLHPSILTPTNIIAELSKTKKYLPPNTNYPFPLSTSNAYMLLDLITIAAYYMDSKLVFLIHIPITENTKCILYHLLPLPISNNNNTYVFINPTFEYLALTPNKMTYSPMSNINCKIISDNTYICLRERPMYNSYSHQICESEMLLTHKNIPKSCDIRIGLITNEIWYQLKEINKWLFVVPETTHVTIDCRKEGIHDIQLSGTGFLHLNPLCKAYTKSVTLEPSTSSISSFIPNFDITLKNEDPNTPRIPPFDFLPLHTPIANLDDLKTASFKLEQISHMADQITHKYQTKEKLKLYDVLISIISTLIMICIIYFLLRYAIAYRRKCRSIKCCTRLCLMFKPSNENEVELRNTTYQSIPDLPNVTNSNNQEGTQPESPSAPPLPTSPRRSARLRDMM